MRMCNCLLYPLVMTNSSPWLLRWPIEIDALPNLNMVDLSMAMLNNQMVSVVYNNITYIIYIYIRTYNKHIIK